MHHSIIMSSLFMAACSSASPTSYPIYDAGKKDSATIYEASTPIEASAMDAGIVVGGTIEAGSFDFLPPDTSPMLYNGGPVLANPIKVYLIYYGDWSAKQSTRSIIDYMIQNIANTGLFKISTKYWENVASANASPETVDGGDAGEGGSYYSDAAFDAANYPDAGTVFVSSSVSLGADVYSYSPDYIQLMRDNDIQTIIKDDITSGVLPLDVNGVYLVLTSADIRQVDTPFESCNDYCGWHSSMEFQNTDIKYSWIGDTAQCPDDCSVEPEYISLGIMQSPNNDWSADGMSNIMLHELAETATDPDVFGHRAWMAEDQSEIGDSCAWAFGNPYWTDAGSLANVKVGNKDYLLQQLWDLDNSFDAGGHCSLTP